ncbi:MAG TPA: nucleotidyltransferase family protein [Terriglobia bacterium]|nr:nucleotidyltransferase family protein [Terriglobia bacterium]
MGVDKVLAAKREEILRLAAKHGARNVRVFGSRAKGEAGSESDVDLLVDMGPDRTPFFPGGLVADLEDLLGRKLDVVTEGGLHWYIREQVLREATPLSAVSGLRCGSRRIKSSTQSSRSLIETTEKSVLTNAFSFGSPEILQSSFALNRRSRTRTPVFLLRGLLTPL